MKKFFKEFKDFIQKGNVLDMAVGIIIGTAFNKIVSSLVNDIIMPVIGLIGGKNIQEARYVLVDAVVDADGKIVKNAVTLNYGNFIQYVIDFLIIAMTVFVIVKVVRGMRRRAENVKEVIVNKIEAKTEDDQIEEEQVEEVVEEVIEESLPTTEEILLEIRDLLKKDNE